MTALALPLVLKIVVTLVAVAVPFLLLSKNALDRLSGFGAPTIAFYRLYGVAILALFFAYAGGVYQTYQGEYPIGVVAMGLVSNIGATLTLLLTGAWATQKALTAFFGFIGLGLVIAGLSPTVAMTPAF